MTREEKENLLREAVDILIKLDNHLMTTRDNAEFLQWVEALIENYCEEREQGTCPFYAN
jgi:ferric-dicitrate binding protein FerR (iron transport regulator)